MSKRRERFGRRVSKIWSRRTWRAVKFFDWTRSPIIIRNLMSNTRWIPELRTRSIKPICVRKEEDGFIKFPNLIIYLILFASDVWFQAGQAVSSALAMGKCKDVFKILPGFLRDSIPSCYNCWCRVRESSILSTFSSA